ncbi:hypothetical protein ACFFUS_14575 [Vibrio gallaecicus]|uniref:hypothetical protein n=1 Tax=Vibrio gallaecicus TaxID=552386 RepID=UPI0010C99737|nr:hypothetical protein [Vibrio gallaecicus]MDN3616921.1 hypothetical protein [Vibrio gallaecicus]
MAASVFYSYAFSFFLLFWSTGSFADHCEHENWDVLRHKHITAENWYNSKTHQFNQMLEYYNAQVFITKEFSEEELMTLWAPHKDLFHRQLHQQIENAHYLSNSLLHQTTLVAQQVDTISGLILAWKRMSIHCENQGSTSNYKAALHYINASQSLTQDLNKLKKKYHSLSQQYLNEAKLIENSKSNYKLKTAHLE